MRRLWTSPEPQRRSSAQDFEELVRTHQSSVFRTLHRLTGSGPHVEDLAQEVFLRLFRALPEFRGDAQLPTYLYRITFNVAQDEWKRRRRERYHIGPVPTSEDEQPGAWLENQPADAFAGEHAQTPEQLLGNAQTAQVIEAALGCLPGIERAVLVLYHQEELSYEGVAAALSLPLNTVRTHLHRGRKRLAGMVQQRLAPQPRPKEQEDPALTRSATHGRAVDPAPSSSLTDSRQPIFRSAQ